MMPFIIRSWLLDMSNRKDRYLCTRFVPVELHWYEAHGIGKRDFKIKAYLDES